MPKLRDSFEAGSVVVFKLSQDAAHLLNTERNRITEVTGGMQPTAAQLLNAIITRNASINRRIAASVANVPVEVVVKPRRGRPPKHRNGHASA
jgi:hypothetical protein